ncbi:tRNA 2-thiocytidine(32) synthetase TtcA [Ignatzschineria larvae DSM 13226]|uniref:tRNA-cytidine(32) 2-sulfurtransferase n=2 Tax=Ignatzschineria larvae TaxID=112009 RepID=A0ABZ3C0H8_9GAMM
MAEHNSSALITNLTESTSGTDSTITSQASVISEVSESMEPVISEVCMREQSHYSVSEKKLEKRLRRQVGRAIMDYEMIEEGDRVMVCLSGGKDSYALLDLLRKLQEKAPVKFELFAVNLDQKQPGFPEEVLPNYLRSINVPFEIIERDTYSVVKRVIPEGKTTCSLCSRLRRGVLYQYAKDHGFNKIALGHHRDDMVETLFMNLFFGGTMKSMPPKLRSDDGENILIRPLAYCEEKDLIKYAQMRQFPIIPCNLCGSQDGLQRQSTKSMLAEWEAKYPGRMDSIFRAMCNIKPSQLADYQLFDFKEFKVKADDEQNQSIANGREDSVREALNWLG